MVIKDDMLYGTELDDAYNMMTDSRPRQVVQTQSQQVAAPQYSQQTQQSEEQPVAQPRVQQVSQAQTSQQEYAPRWVSQQQRQVAQSQAQQAPQVVRTPVYAVSNNVASSPSYLDSMISKRREVLKIIILATTIVLGISIHSVVEFWLREYFVSRDLGFKQEFGSRLLYPGLVILVIWMLKAVGK